MILDLGPDVSWADKYAWAPAMAKRDGKYYFYFCAEQQIGVAVADSPPVPSRTRWASRWCRRAFSWKAR